MVDWNVIGVKICRSIGPDLNKQTGLTDMLGSSFSLKLASYTQNGRKRKKTFFFSWTSTDVSFCWFFFVFLLFIFLHKFFPFFTSSPWKWYVHKVWIKKKVEDDWFFDTRRNWEELIVAPFEKTFFYSLGVEIFPT